MVASPNVTGSFTEKTSPTASDQQRKEPVRLHLRHLVCG